MKFDSDSYPINAFRICLEENKNGIEGVIYSPLCQNEIEFNGIEAFMKMDEVFDKAGYPQAFQDKRSFLKKAEKTNNYLGRPDVVYPIEELLTKKGTKETLDVWVNTRMNTSWQGVVYNSAGDECGTFDSDVDLWCIIEKIVG